MLSLVSALLDMTLECARIERLEQLKATEQLGGNRHNGAPVVKFAAVLLKLADYPKGQIRM